MTDYVCREEQQQIVEDATTRQKETVRFFLFTSVSTEGAKQQLHLYIYGRNQEGHVKASLKLFTN